ncbi:MAG: beta-lactamase family protein [Candidatus Marinimicrobia bacterium]|nr:beta-lactamase family protein [Candidatus Neomarinimicrobiota bacterium]
MSVAAIILLISCTSDRNSKVEQLFADYQGEQPGAAVMVIHKGQPILAKTFGLADLEHLTPVIPQTNFRLASVTKQFTAFCIMILVERGLLDYTSSLTDIFPDFPEYGITVMVKHLLQHTSGLIAYEDLIPDTATVPVLDYVVLTMMMEQDSTYFVPGSDYRYSNSGYAVLTMIVEKLSGRSFASFLEENIFEPLGMSGTVAYQKGISNVRHRAFGYIVNGDSVIFNDQSITSSVLGDGGIYTSLLDLYKWDQALYTDRLVTRKSLEQAFKPGLEDYGFGWYIDDYQGYHRVYHTGSTCGFRNAYLRYPDDQLSIIILTNRRDPAVKELAEKLTKLYLP